MNNNKKMAYDEIKGMLNTMRHLSESSLNKKRLIESEESETIEPVNNDATQEQYDDIVVVNDVDVKLLSTDKLDIELKDEEKSNISQLIDSFRQEVYQIPNLSPGFTINENQIRLDGSIDENEINFVFVAGQNSGLYINSDMLKIDLETLQMLEKLMKFEQTFMTTIEPLVRTRTDN